MIESLTYEDGQEYGTVEDFGHMVIVRAGQQSLVLKYYQVSQLIKSLRRAREKISEVKNEENTY